MAKQILGMVTIPVAGGKVTVSSEGMISIESDTAGGVCVSVDEVTGIQIAEALLVFVAEATRAKYTKRNPNDEGTTDDTDS